MFRIDYRVTADPNVPGLEPGEALQHLVDRFPSTGERFAFEMDHATLELNAVQDFRDFYNQILHIFDAITSGRTPYCPYAERLPAPTADETYCGVSFAEYQPWMPLLVFLLKGEDVRIYRRVESMKASDGDTDKAAPSGVCSIQSFLAECERVLSYYHALLVTAVPAVREHPDFVWAEDILERSRRLAESK